LQHSSSTKSERRYAIQRNFIYKDKPYSGKTLIMRVKFSLLKLPGKQHNLNNTRHLPLSVQKQRAKLLSLAAKLSKAGRRVQWRVVGTDYCLYAGGEPMADKISSDVVSMCKFYYRCVYHL